MESTRFDVNVVAEKVSVFIMRTLKLFLKAVGVMIAASVIHLAINQPLFGPYYEDFMEGFAWEDATPAPVRSWEEWRANAEEVPYRTLFRYAEDYKGKTLYFRGKIVQVIEGENMTFSLRVNVTPPGGSSPWWTDTVYLYYGNAQIRPLEDDIISVVGTGEGVYTYTSVEDVEITIPLLYVRALKIETEESTSAKLDIDRR
ncbi:MAG: hypothetical protein OXF86_22870 [Caldilineaceae bacterium]|nr:hypothetical protein [Caldilineaceae bacterium]